MDSQQQFIEGRNQSMNEDQQRIFQECIGSSGSIFCTGQGGTGKSWLLECIVAYFREFPLSDNRYVAVTASTGIAAFTVKGITLHRFAGVGIEEENLQTMIAKASKGVSYLNWTRTDILIIDEISMVSPVFFNNLSRMASYLRDNELPFGGIRIIMFGDMLQLPPVSRGTAEIIDIFNTDAWISLSPKVMQLRHIIRQTNVEFQRILTEIRYGKCSERSEEYLRSLDREVQYDDDIEPVRLFAKRDMTLAFNKSKLDSINGPQIVSVSTDSGNISVLKQCPAPARLELKVGSQVILIRNLDTQAVNGSVGLVTGFQDVQGQFYKKPIVKLTSFSGNPFTITLQKCLWETIAPNGSVVASRLQYPLILAWAITIHRSQSQTIPRLCVDMTGIFEVGQAYVALSRCPSPDNLQVTNFNKNCIMASLSAVHFYQLLDEEESTSEELPSYSEVSATSVAHATDERWDRPLVQCQSPLTEELPQDTHVMLGNLSLRDQ